MHEKLSTDQLISHHRVREDYVESPQNTLQFGYGDHRYVKFTYDLYNQSDVLKIKILNQLEEDFSSLLNVDLCLKSSDLLSVLLLSLKHKDPEIRRLCTVCIAKVCASPFGRKQIIKRQAIEKLEAMLHDEEEKIRQAATHGLINFSQFIEGIDTMLDSPVILKELVEKLISEKKQHVLNNIVRILKMLMQGEEGTPKALHTEIISRLVNLIEHPLASVRYNVCMTLANISFNEQGKHQIVAKGHIRSIIPKLKDTDALVRQASALLLCSLAQLNQGKIEILAQAEFAAIVGLLDEDAPTALNALQLVTSLAENPQGRVMAAKYLDKIGALKQVEKIYIDAALEVIKWTP